MALGKLGTLGKGVFPLQGSASVSATSVGEFYSPGGKREAQMPCAIIVEAPMLREENTNEQRSKNTMRGQRT